MIIAKIYGGFGNQLFQYTCGRAVALRLGVKLTLDLSFWWKSQPFPYSLGHFNIQTDICEQLSPRRRRGIARLFRSLLTSSIRTYREESVYNYDTGIEDISDGTRLKGYWQSERYFKDCEAIIRKDLQFCEKPPRKTALILGKIEQEPAVSLHIRRGDYISNPKANAFHGVLELKYYERAIELIAAQMTEEPIVYVFSDDCDWAKENLSLPFEIRTVDHNNQSTAHDDMRLMAACQHHIIANSSFSWWGAWLNPSDQKIVVAPKQWFRHRDHVDIVPADWHRL